VCLPSSVHGAYSRHAKLHAFSNSSIAGLPPVWALFYGFPDKPELFNIDRRWLLGSDILVTLGASLEGERINCTTTTATDMLPPGIFPSRGNVIWHNWYMHATVNATSGGNIMLNAPISHINIHIRNNSALLLHRKPEYMLYKTLKDPYSLLVSLNAAGTAFGTAYVEDDISFLPGPSQSLTFRAAESTFTIDSKREYEIQQMLEMITVLGMQRPTQVSFQGSPVERWTCMEATEELVVSNTSANLNGQATLMWRYSIFLDHWTDHAVRN
jgi:alpha-glucosidase